MAKWKIEYYNTPSGREPVQEFIDSFADKIKSRLHNTFELLSEFGPFLRMPHVKKVIGTPLWELRILGKSSLRFFYVVIVKQSFLILHGFAKHKQKTPKKEIKTALDRLREYKQRIRITP